MSRTWITDADVAKLELPLGSLTRKDAKSIYVFLGDSGQPTPHQWRSRKEARRWLSSLAVVPVWRKGVYYDYLYEGITLRPAQEINGQGAPILDDELAFEGEPLEPVDAFIEDATTFEVPTDASIADLKSDSHVDVADALQGLDSDDANLEEWNQRTRANAQARHEDKTAAIIETVRGIRDRIAEAFPPDDEWRDLWESDKALLAQEALAGSDGPLTCGEHVWVGLTHYLCELAEGHPGQHRDMEEQFEWGPPQFFGMGILGGGPKPQEAPSTGTFQWESCGSRHGGIPCQGRLDHIGNHYNRLEGNVAGVPNIHTLQWETPNDDQHSLNAPSHRRSALAGVTLEIPVKLEFEDDDLAELTENALRLLSVDITCQSTCVVDGTRCTLVQGHTGWHFNDTRTWRWGVEDPESSIDPLERNDTFSDTTCPTIYNGGMQSPIEADGLDPDLLKPGGELYGVAFDEGEVPIGWFELLEHIEEIGIPDGYSITVRTGDRLYAWEGHGWQSRIACNH